jgi:hypothetical protein
VTSMRIRELFTHRHRHKSDQDLGFGYSRDLDPPSPAPVPEGVDLYHFTGRTPQEATP